MSGPLGICTKPAIGFVRSEHQATDDRRPHIQMVVTDAWGNDEFSRRVYGTIHNQREEVNFLMYS